MCELSQEYLHSLFNYNEETGEFKRKDGSKTGYYMQTGYHAVSVDGKPYLVHRLIFIMMTGDWPKHNVDHINRNREDNRWCNLRDVEQKYNVRNMTTPSHNKSGVKGVYWDKQCHKWRAQICLNNKTKYLGVFNSKSEAIKVRQEAEIANGFIQESEITIEE